MKKPRAWKRWVIGGTVAFLGLTAIAHTPQGLAAFAWLSGKDGCPFGKDAAAPALTVAETEQIRLQAIAVREEPAPARPALGFALDQQTRGDLIAWTLRHGLACSANKSTSGLRCDRIDGALLPEPLVGVTGTLMLGFDPADRLISVSFQTASTTPQVKVLEVASGAMATLEQLGARSTGDELAAPDFIHRETRATFANYAATVVASTVGERWMSIQTFQSIPERLQALAAR